MESDRSNSEKLLEYFDKKGLPQDHQDKTDRLSADNIFDNHGEAQIDIEGVRPRLSDNSLGSLKQFSSQNLLGDDAFGGEEFQGILSQNVSQEKDSKSHKEEDVFQERIPGVLEPSRKFKIFKSNSAAEAKSNEVKTHKYNFFSFLPMNLLQQFSKMANVYFLALSFLQMVPQISITYGHPTILTGLIPVIMISMIKDLLEDLKRRKEDRVENNQAIQRIDEATHGFQDDIWRNLKVGQIVKVRKNERFPADLILLKSSDPSGLAYVETMSLDGETNLKHKQAVKDLQDGIGSPAEASTIVGEVICDGPNDRLYYFEGQLQVSMKQSSYSYKYPVSHNQLLLRGSSLKITQWIYGIVVYTGTETKIKQNDRKHGQFKKSRMDITMSKQILIILIVQFLLAAGGALLSNIFDHRMSSSYYLQPSSLTFLPQDQDFDPTQTPPIAHVIGEVFRMFPQMILVVKFGTWILLLTNFVPISLLVTVEMVKYFQAMFIEWDADMIDASTGKSAKVQQSSLNEELGQVNYIFSDKTGTLTQNHMSFKNMSIGGISYGQKARSPQVEHEAAKKDITNFKMNDPTLEHLLAFGDTSDQSFKTVQHFLRHLAVCHTIVTSQDPKDEKKFILNSSSPDELALVNGAAFYGVKFVERNDINEIVLACGRPADFMQSSLHSENSSDQIISSSRNSRYGPSRIPLAKYKLLNVIEFTSARKRMSVVVRDLQTREIIVMTKGADSVLLPLLAKDPSNEELKKTTLRHLQKYAQDGLRTLMMCDKVISEEDYKEWARQFEIAKQAIEDRQTKLEAAHAILENNLRLLGATAIEDELQEKVAESISAIKEANIKFWMLTGDKMETAINIGYSCRVLDQNSVLFKIDMERKQDIMKYLAQCLRAWYVHENKINAGNIAERKVNFATVIEGSSFSKIQQSLRLTESFIKLAILSDVVIACRLSPKQKTEMVSFVQKQKPDSVTLAVGDGANDVGMICQANIGVGLSGKEGNQAVSSSDYSLAQFKDLKTLLLFHGREAYRRNAYVVCYMFFKNMLQNAPIILYGFFSGFSGQMFYESYMSQVYNLVFTSCPIVLYAIQDCEFEKQDLVANPKLYLDGPKRVHFNSKVFSTWIFYTLAQSALILWVSFYAMTKAFNIPLLETGGKTADIWAIGSLVYAAVVCNVNNRLLQDSNSVSVLVVAINIFSSLSFFGVYWIVDHYKSDELFQSLDSMAQFPAFILIFVYFYLLMWPINTLQYYGIQSNRQEEQLQMVEESRQSESIKGVPAIDLAAGFEDEESPLLVSQLEPEKPMGVPHTGYAFSAEEGLDPQIEERLARDQRAPTAIN